MVKVKNKAAQRLKLGKSKRVSPILEKCCWLMIANESYQRAEEDLDMLMGIKIGHSNLHRLIQTAEIPQKPSTHIVQSLSVDGGKVRLRNQSGGAGEWRDYKAVSLHGSLCKAYFQDNEKLLEWANKQNLATMVTCLGDGHDGVWNSFWGYC